MTRPALPAFALALLAAMPAMAAAHWTLRVDAREAVLTTDEGSGEDSATMLRCRVHKGGVDVTMFVNHNEATDEPAADGSWRNKAGQKAPWRTQMTVASGAVSAAVAAKSNVDEMNGGTQVDASVPAAAPVMAEFGKTGKLKLTAYGESSRDPAVPATKAAKFLAACSK
jgi:hypothetical protein